MNISTASLFCTIALVGFSTVSFGQASKIELRDLNQRLEKLEQSNERLSLESKRIKSEFGGKIESADRTIQDLKEQIESNEKLIESLKNQLEGRIAASETTSTERDRNLAGAISRNQKLATTAGAALLVFLAVLFIFFRRRSAADKNELADTIQRTRESLEQEGLKLDEKLIDLLAKQMDVSPEIPKSAGVEEDKLDHTLALKVADEIVRIQKNISIMDPNTRGVKQLAASIRRIKDNIEANGYELVEMLNRPYDRGMNVTANFRPDPNLRSDEQIITRIIKPQVNFRGVMIQAAQIEVSQGE